MKRKILAMLLMLMILWTGMAVPKGKGGNGRAPDGTLQGVLPIKSEISAGALKEAEAAGEEPLSPAGPSITQDTQNQSGKINVDYSADVTYTVTIPASVTFTDTLKTVERGLQVRDVRLNEGGSLRVNVASLNDFKMKNGEGYIDYSLVINSHPAPEEDSYTVLEVDAGEDAGWAVLSFTTDLNKEHAPYAGKYTDTLTFTVTLG